LKLTVNDNGVRPAGKPDECFYCHEKVGNHKNDCVCVEKAIIIELKVKLIVTVPNYWNTSNIEFKYNGSSHCLGNEIKQLFQENEKIESECFTCHRSSVEFIGDASIEDIKRLSNSDELHKRVGLINKGLVN
jgi:hypothetical protein